MNQELFDSLPPKPKRKNNPELIRHALLMSAKTLMITEGIANLSMQKVADGAGVSKGGLFHHFKSKDELTGAVIELYIAQLNTAILDDIAVHGERFGAFTRAYVRVFFDNADIGLSSDWSGLIRAMSADHRSNELWQTWLASKLKQYAQTDHDPRLTAIRYAIDGAWLNGEMNTENGKVLKDYLLELIDEMLFL